MTYGLAIIVMTDARRADAIVRGIASSSDIVGILGLYNTSLRIWIEWKITYLVVDGGCGSHCCLLLDIGGDQDTGDLEAGDYLRPGASRDGIGDTGLAGTARDEDIPAAIPADEDAAARVASTALEAVFLACGQIAVTGSGEGGCKEAHESEREDEKLHG